MTELKNLTKEELINKSTEIITQDFHTDADRKELATIQYLLALQYMNINVSGSAREGKYNKIRAERTVQLQEEMAVGKAENIAKSEAESAYEGRRELNAEAQGLSKLLNTIDGFIIGLQSQFKAEGKIPFNS